MPNYMNIIGEFFPAADAMVDLSAGGDPTVYNDIVWVTAPIAQGTLDTYDGQEGTTLNSDIVLNNQSFSNRQIPIYDSVAGQWKNQSFGKLYRYNTLPQTFGGTWATAFFDGDVRTDTELYTYASLPFGTTTFLEAGWYEVTYDMTADSTGSSRQISEHKATINGSDVTGSLANGYHRTTNAGKSSVSVTFLINVSVNDVFRIQCRSITGANLTTVSSGCRLRIRAEG